MTAAWNDLPADCQLWLAERAMQRAYAIVMQEAEALAGEIDRGDIEDPGGADALRLLVRLFRLAQLRSQAAAGRA